MLNKGICLSVFLIFCIILITEGQTLTAKEIVKKADDKSRGLTSQGEMTMTIVRPTWTRSVSMKNRPPITDNCLNVEQLIQKITIFVFNNIIYITVQLKAEL